MTSRRLWIIEGPDGSGKSTLAAQLSHRGARVTHLGPFPRVTKGLARLYLEAMLPALHGFCDVVLDRSWLSEPVYAEARRHAPSRLGRVDLRMLERAAARCQTTVVRCLPPLAACAEAWAARRGTEYLRTAEELAGVWGLYAVGLATQLPTIDFDYRAQHEITVIKAGATHAHPLAVASAGYLDAPVLLVGDRFADHKDSDALAQYPFVSFSDGGCSRWLTAQLDRAGVAERSLLWANADQDIGALFSAGACPRVVVALGEAAVDKVETLSLRVNGIKIVRVSHPQHAKRFGFKARYELLDVLKEALS